nr:riboflavin synthase [uncultured Anaerostipes sp.]
MFTGIIEELGKVVSLKRGSQAAVLTIEGNVIFDDLKLGDSVAVNGVCLTASHISGNVFQADVMNETFHRSSLGSLQKGDRVNLERAMAANGRFGGHMVAGHIDAAGELISKKKDDNAVWFTVKAPPQVMRYCVEKGSIALDGISLTIAELGEDTISVSMIPHTMEHTNFASKKIGDRVNLENDMVGKYVEKLSQTPKEQEKKTSGITMETLLRAGF